MDGFINRHRSKFCHDHRFSRFRAELDFYAVSRNNEQHDLNITDGFCFRGAANESNDRNATMTSTTANKPKLQLVSQEDTAMVYNTDDLRIRDIKELLPPAHLMNEFPCTDKASTTVYRARQAIKVG